jgi:hypothetical protein
MLELGKPWKLCRERDGNKLQIDLRVHRWMHVLSSAGVGKEKPARLVKTKQRWDSIRFQWIRHWHSVEIKSFQHKIGSHKSEPGLPDFSWNNICTKTVENIPYCYILDYRMDIICTKWPLYVYSKWPKNIATFSISRPSKIYPIWDFWFENIQLGNPGQSLHRRNRI